jgi:toxin ParE1/3/4
MSRLRFSPRAERDLNEIGDHIKQRNPAAAERWVDLIESKCRSLAEQPGLGRPRRHLRQDLRSFAVGNYIIFYRRIGDGIEIVRVLHGRRDIAALFAGRNCLSNSILTLGVGWSASRPRKNGARPRGFMSRA